MGALGVICVLSAPMNPTLQTRKLRPSSSLTVSIKGSNSAGEMPLENSSGKISWGLLAPLCFPPFRGLQERQEGPQAHGEGVEGGGQDLAIS